MVGDQNDIVGRLQRLIPAGWFPIGMVPIRDALLSGAANALAFVYGLLAYIQLQTRLATATDGFLDLVALDFFGNKIFRAANQTNTSFRATIAANMFRERGTRNAVIQVLEQLTGQTPMIFEPRRAADTGAYNTGSLGYGVAGGYGSMQLSYQSFVKAYTGGSIGIPNVAGYDISTGGYDMPSQAAYEDATANELTNDDIYAAVESVRPIGYTIWVAILPGPPSAFMEVADDFVRPTSWSFDSSLVTMDSTEFTFDGGS